MSAPLPTTHASLCSPELPVLGPPKSTADCSGFDLACDRGDYSLEQQYKDICSRIHLTCTPIEIAGFWAQAFSSNSDVLDILSQVRASAVTAVLTNNGPLVRMIESCDTG